MTTSEPSYVSPDCQSNFSTLNLDEIFGALYLPAKGSAEFTSGDKIMLTGASGLWGKSLVLQMVDDSSRKACATITVCYQKKSTYCMKLHYSKVNSFFCLYKHTCHHDTHI
jgi:hypothetical protein